MALCGLALRLEYSIRLPYFPVEFYRKSRSTRLLRAEIGANSRTDAGNAKNTAGAETGTVL